MNFQQETDFFSVPFFPFSKDRKGEKKLNMHLIFTYAHAHNHMHSYKIYTYLSCIHQYININVFCLFVSAFFIILGKLQNFFFLDKYKSNEKFQTFLNAYNLSISISVRIFSKPAFDTLLFFRACIFSILFSFYNVSIYFQNRCNTAIERERIKKKKEAKFKAKIEEKKQEIFFLDNNILWIFSRKYINVWNQTPDDFIYKSCGMNRCALMPMYSCISRGSNVE